MRSQIATVVCLVSVLGAAGVEVRNTVRAATASGLVIVKGEVDLPGDGLWQLQRPTPDDQAVRQLQLRPPPLAVRGIAGGRRLAAVRRQDLLNQGSGPLHLHWECRQYAQKHDGRGPTTSEDLGTRDHGWSRSPYTDYADAEGPFYFLVPDVPYNFEPDNGRVLNSDLQAVELRPLLNDGKHWVLTTNGRVQRLEVDEAFMRQHGLTLRPLRQTADLFESPETLTYQLYGQWRRDAVFSFTVRDAEGGRAIPCTWKILAPAAAADPAGCVREWSRLRTAEWRELAAGNDAPILRNWIALHEAMYAKADIAEQLRPRRDAPRDTSVFNMLGGRAAMRETLQLEVLNMPAKVDQTGSVPLSEIPSVEVKSHPFAEMLAGKPGGRLPLAEYVPADRAFIYAKPAAVLPFLGAGSGFVADLGAAATSRALSYDLKNKYLRRLGMDETWLETLLKSGVITEMAAFAPDLFFIEGTEITCIVHVEQLGVMLPLLRLIGVGAVSGGAISEVPTAGGGTVYWGAAGDLLLVSTSRQELQAALALGPDAPGSLAASAELRFMLTQLPPQPMTRAYVYFSDGFIRNLVGPTCKIGQLRRLQAKAGLQLVSSAALLYQLDGHQSPPTLARLRSLGYIPDDLHIGSIDLGEDLVASSPTYGTVEDLAPIIQVPVEMATTAEEEAYKRYRETYQRYWRRFFDPIAVRLDDTADGGLAMHTFILPLLDNSLYNGLRRIIPESGRGQQLRAPVIEPAPVAMLSLTLRDEAWTDWIRDFVRRAATVVDARVLDALGPGMHVAVHDGDPIIALGSGDSLGIFGGRLSGAGGDWLAIPFFVSALTRPCSLYLETGDPEAWREALAGEFLSQLLGRTPLSSDVSSYRLDGRDAWIYAIQIERIVTLHFGIAVQGDYVVITNLPWSNRVTVVGSEPATLSGARLALEPQAVEKQLAALYTVATDRQRRSAMEGIGYLQPLFEAGLRDRKGAAQLHARLMGFAPVHAAGGEWRWEDGRTVSSMFGHPRQQRQPSYRPGDRSFGLLDRVRQLRVSMQLEDTGLRSVVSWHFDKSAE